MSNTIVVGTQWGDEGKGKVVDYLTEYADVVVRAQGGNNAGHTVICEGEKHVLHLMPSGILWSGKRCLIGNGVALDPTGLVKEIEGLEAKGISITPDSLLISERAHLTLPFHRELDALGEAGRGSSKLGTTKRGIGPTYMDKAQRCGLRLVDALDLQAFTDTLWERLTHTNEALAAAGFERMDLEGVGKETLAAVERLLPHMANTIAVIHGAMEDGKKVLFEGA
ncbi:MAG: adenylosuccinate synthetase, partial [Verrucomicrobiota bacterium]